MPRTRVKLLKIKHTVLAVVKIWRASLPLYMVEHENLRILTKNNVGKITI